MVLNNKIKNIEELREKPLKFFTKSKNKTFRLLEAIGFIFKNNIKNPSVYRCQCDNLFIFLNEEKEGFKFHLDSNNNLPCPICGKYELDIDFIFKPKGDTKKIIEELDLLFNLAKEKNKFTYYMFLSQCFGDDNKVLNEILESVFSYLYIIDNLNFEFLSRKYSNFTEIEEINFEKTILKLRLLIYCNFIELKYIYNLIVNLIFIAFEKFRAVEKGIRKISSARIKMFNDQWIVKDIINRIKNIADKYNLFIGTYMKDFYDNELRNAFYHSQYIIENENIILTNCDRSIELEKLNRILNNCLNLFRHFTEKFLNERGELIAIDTIEENGFKIIPQRNGKKIAFRYEL